MKTLLALFTILPIEIILAIIHQYTLFVNKGHIDWEALILEILVVLITLVFLMKRIHKMIDEDDDFKKYRDW